MTFGNNTNGEIPGGAGADLENRVPRIQFRDGAGTWLYLVRSFPLCPIVCGELS
jgi:hypothetical protein